jgi:hypothetical protein
MEALRIGGKSPVNVIEGSGSPTTPGLHSARRGQASEYGDTYEPPHVSPTNDLPPLLSGVSTPHLPLNGGQALDGLQDLDPPAGQSSVKKARRKESGQLSTSELRQSSPNHAPGTSHVSSIKSEGESSSSSLQSFLQPIRGSGLQGRNLRPNLLPLPNVAAGRSQPTGPSDALMERIRSMQETQMSQGACQSLGIMNDSASAHDSLHGRLVQAVDEASARDEVRCNPGTVLFALTKNCLCN